jgi:outer membrane protein assembly factor BamB
MQWVGYDLDTGNQLWGPTASQSAFDYYGNPGTVTLGGVIAYGNIYVSSFSGILYCYNDRTGELLWTYGNGGEGNSTNAGFNVFYGAYSTQIQSISNGVVYTATDEHTVPNPIYKGATYRAINATTGEEIWVLSGYPSEWSTAGSAWATADGYLTCMNGYDQ